MQKGIASTRAAENTSPARAREVAKGKAFGLAVSSVVSGTMLETCRDTGARGDLWLVGGSCLWVVGLGENIAASKLLSNSCGEGKRLD